MVEQDGLMARVVATLREPVTIDPELDRRVMAEITADPARRDGMESVRSMLDWLVRGRPVRVSPLGGLALAASIAALVLMGRSWLPQSGALGTAPEASSLAATTAGAPVQFVVVVPRARSVALVGDFNDWSTSATPMHAAAGNGVWSVTIPLADGRYRYAFLVDGSTWLTDPSAPRDLDGEFGPPNSVLTVGGS